MKKLIRITTVPLSLDKLLGRQLSFMSGHFRVTAVSAHATELQRVAEKYGVANCHIEMSRAITPAGDLKALWQFYCFLRREKPAIVHSHTPKAGIVGMLAAKLAGVPIRLHTVAGLPLMESHGAKRKLLNFVERLTYRCATKVYPNSQGLYDFIVTEKLAQPEKLKVIANGSSNGIDTSHFNRSALDTAQLQQLKTNLRITENDFVFIFVGRLVGDKGINELITAFTNLAPDTPHPRHCEKAKADAGTADIAGRTPKLLLVGPHETDLDPLLPETLREIEQDPNIISVGYQDDVRPYLAIADALVFPSYREGFPNVVLQAGAMELPAIASDINGCNEIISDGHNGLIVPTKTAEPLQTAMHRLTKDADLYTRLKQNSRALIMDRYEQSVVWQALLEEYQKALGNV